MDVSQSKSENVSHGITKYTCRKNGNVFYKATKHKRSKFFYTIKEAQKYIDFVCLELNKKQIYGTFKSV